MDIMPKVKNGGFLIYEGSKFSIISARVSSGKSPFWQLLDSLISAIENTELSSRSPKKIEAVTLMAYFKKFCEHGPWKNDTQIKALYDGFFEFKVKETGLRVPFYYDKENRAVIILTHYFYKKSQKTPKKELEKMENIKKEFSEYRKIKRIK